MFTGFGLSPLLLLGGMAFLAAGLWQWSAHRGRAVFLTAAGLLLLSPVALVTWGEAYGEPLEFEPVLRRSWPSGSTKVLRREVPPDAFTPLRGGATWERGDWSESGQRERLARWAPSGPGTGFPHLVDVSLSWHANGTLESAETYAEVEPEEGVLDSELGGAAGYWRADGSVDAERTGHYDRGLRVRALTAEELVQLIATAELFVAQAQVPGEAGD